MSSSDQPWQKRMYQLRFEKKEANSDFDVVLETWYGYSIYQQHMHMKQPIMELKMRGCDGDYLNSGQ